MNVSKRQLMSCAVVVLVSACGGGENAAGGGSGGTTGQLSGEVRVFQGAESVALQPRLQDFVAQRRAKAERPAIPSDDTVRRAPDERRTIAGQLIVRTVEKVGAAQTLKLLRDERFDIAHRSFVSEHLHVLTVKHAGGAPLTEGQTLEAAQTLGAKAGISFAEADQWQFAFAVPDDKLYSAQWHYAALNLPAAWDVGQGQNSVVVAVIDTGITAHPDLDPRVVPGIDLISNPMNAGDGDGVDANPRDEGGDQPNGGSSWHGTHVAGTIGAATNNGTGVAGVDWNARVQPVRVLGKEGGSLSDIATAMVWSTGGTVPGLGANPTPARVVNMSLGGTSDASPSYQDAIDEAVGRGAVFVVAAGNSNVDASRTIPCIQRNVICVGATRFSGSRASYSNFGAPVTVMAPGGEVAEDQNGDGYPDGVLSTFRDAQNAPGANFLQGTSMASPHVAGIVALMKALKPALTQSEAAMVLTSTASGTSKCNEGCGAGMVNAHAALLAAKGTMAQGPGKLAVASSDLFFNESQPRVSILVSNVGGQALSVTASVGGGAAQAVAIAGSSFTLEPGKSVNLALEASFAGLADGTHSAVLTLAAGGEQVSVNIKLKKGGATMGTAGVALVYQDEMGELQVAAETETTFAQGYAFTLSAKPGTYYLFGAIDANRNGQLDTGEPIGFWPTIERPEPIELKAGDVLTGAEFTLVPFKAVSEESTTIIGTECSGTCAGGAICVTGFPNGYCTQSCITDACPLGSACTRFAEDNQVCLAVCTGPGAGRSGCRAGYVCYADGTGAGVCLPSCANDTDCDGTAGSCNTTTGYCR